MRGQRGRKGRTRRAALGRFQTASCSGGLVAPPLPGGAQRARVAAQGAGWADEGASVKKRSSVRTAFAISTTTDTSRPDSSFTYDA